MTVKDCRQDAAYQGFEQGPIRPPSEAGSLLIRITRNCPWNRCTFCPVYKGREFSLRAVEHVLEDINRVHRYIGEIRKCSADGKVYPANIARLRAMDGPGDRAALNAALQWAAGGMRSIFLQDANSSWSLASRRAASRNRASQAATARRFDAKQFNAREEREDSGLPPAKAADGIRAGVVIVWLL